jgi:hypothetical protein
MTTQVSSDYFRDKAKADIAIKRKIDQSLSADSRKLIEAAREARVAKVDSDKIRVLEDGRVVVRLR